MLKILEETKELTTIIYSSIKLFPKFELYILSSQLLRATISVRLNIREGNTFKGDKKINFFKIALGSLEEVDECMLIALEQGYINNSEHEVFREKYWFVLNMLKKLIRSGVQI